MDEMSVNRDLIVSKVSFNCMLLFQWILNNHMLSVLEVTILNCLETPKVMM